MNTTARIKVWIGSLCLALLLPLFSSSLHAQAENADRTEKRIEHLKKELSLTDDQTTKVKDILTRAQAQAEKDREANKGDRKAMMEAARNRMKNTDSEISATLTPEQVTKYNTLKDEMRENIKDHFKERQNKQ